MYLKIAGKALFLQANFLEALLQKFVCGD